MNGGTEFGDEKCRGRKDKEKKQEKFMVVKDGLSKEMLWTIDGKGITNRKLGIENS